MKIAFPLHGLVYTSHRYEMMMYDFSDSFSAHHVGLAVVLCDFFCTNISDQPDCATV